MHVQFLCLVYEYNEKLWFNNSTFALRYLVMKMKNNKNNHKNKGVKERRKELKVIFSLLTTNVHLMFTSLLE